MTAEEERQMRELEAEIERIGRGQDRAEDNERATHAENLMLRTRVAELEAALRAVVDIATTHRAEDRQVVLAGARTANRVGPWSARSGLEPCDGNHAAPPCASDQCWHRPHPPCCQRGGGFGCCTEHCPRLPGPTPPIDLIGTMPSIAKELQDGIEEVIADPDRIDPSLGPVVRTSRLRLLIARIDAKEKADAAP